MKISWTELNELNDMEIKSIIAKIFREWIIQREAPCPYRGICNNLLDVLGCLDKTPIKVIRIDKLYQYHFKT